MAIVMQHFSHAQASTKDGRSGISGSAQGILGCITYDVYNGVVPIHV